MVKKAKAPAPKKHGKTEKATAIQRAYEWERNRDLEVAGMPHCANRGAPRVLVPRG